VLQAMTSEERETFRADLMQKYLSEVSMQNMMQEILINSSDEELIRFFTVPVGMHLNRYEFAVEEFRQNPSLRNDPKEDRSGLNMQVQVMLLRPQSKKYCEEATSMLQRMFSHQYLPEKKFGKVNYFVCDFIESENGLVYLNKVAAIGCDFVIGGTDYSANPETLWNARPSQSGETSK
jgi:hypothetical protein